MQVGGRIGVLVIKGAVQGSLAVWVEGRQLDGRTGKVLVKKGGVQGSSIVWVGGHLGGRTGGVLVMKGAVRGSSAVRVGGSGGVGAKLDSCTRENDEVASAKDVSITDMVEVERDKNENTASINLT